MSAAPLTIAAINALDEATFVATFGGVYEAAPWVAVAAWAARPFADLAALELAFDHAVTAAGPEAQLALIRAHPDLVGRAALTGSIGASSTAEQAAAGLTPGALTADEVSQFAAYNASYRERFDMPFVICARDNKKDAILAAFPRRLANDPAAELITALTETRQIAHHRLAALVAVDTP